MTTPDKSTVSNDMATRHTELPWAICQEAPNPQWYPGATIYCVPQDTRVADVCVLTSKYEANAQFIVRACNSHYTLTEQNRELREALNKLEVSANTVDYCYQNTPGNFASALQQLVEDAGEARSLTASLEGKK